MYIRTYIHTRFTVCVGMSKTKTPHTALQVCKYLKQAAEEAAKSHCLQKGLKTKSLWAAMRGASWTLQLHRMEKGALAVCMCMYVYVYVCVHVRVHACM